MITYATPTLCTLCESKRKPIMNRELLKNYFMGNCPAEDIRSVEQWINNNMETDEFSRLCCEMLEDMNLSDPAETRRAYRRLRRRIATTYGTSPYARRNRFLNRAAGVVAIIAVATSFVFAFYLNNTQPIVMPSEPDMVQLYSKRGVNKKILMPDSTEITLFGDSRIVYDRNGFNDNRRVWLFGDAFFDVAKKEGNAFDVKCTDTDIHVTGTSFEVLSHDADDNFEVSLYKGSVRLTPRYNGHHDTLRLYPGDVVRIDKAFGTITRHTVPWLDNDSTNVIYIGSTVSDILSRLERRYDKSIILQDKSKAVSKTRLNLIFHSTDSLKTILSAICEFSDLKMRRQGEDIVLTYNP